jgi:hypothetical protein
MHGPELPPNGLIFSGPAGCALLGTLYFFRDRRAYQVEGPMNRKRDGFILLK